MTAIEKALRLPTEKAQILAIGQIVGQKIKGTDQFEYLTAAEKTFIYIDILEGAVGTGGFANFFYNSSGQFADEILAAYQTIGARHTAALLRSAIRLFPAAPVPKNLEQRQDILLAAPSYLDLWDDLDEAFHRCPDPIGALVIRFVVDHKGDFGFPLE
ncbi:MAG: hypothetical protein DA408_09800 [Bacteroidetes bacterium]|nr:MAG: hypothetical protein C7N36_05545 [Bacteroidota bacterium]PTM12691.1 MAG: hypothetical protein DA408_09800 [Bacteroidota bacterium]